jgi:hypothetical protein
MSVAQRAHVDEDGTFLINFVMDGDYTLRVTGGKLDGDDAQDKSSNGATSAVVIRHRIYKDIDMPLSVHGDITNLVIALNE